MRIAEIRGPFYDFDPEYSLYGIRAVIDDGLEVVMRIGPEQPAAASTKPDPSTVAFAELVAAKTGAQLDLVGVGR